MRDLLRIDVAVFLLLLSFVSIRLAIITLLTCMAFKAVEDFIREK